MLTARLFVFLKARQIGMTWLCLASFLWLCLFHDGRVCLLFSKTELDAYELARRVRAMYGRLPAWMQAQRRLTTDNKGELEWDNGSRVLSLAATRSAGRTYTASAVFLDEFAHMQWGEDVYTAVKPTMDAGGQLFINSTANGEGNRFHKLWQAAV